MGKRMYRITQRGEYQELRGQKWCKPRGGLSDSDKVKRWRLLKKAREKTKKETKQ